MKPFPDCSNCSIFPEPESNWLEFKRNISCLTCYKLKQLFCAFLNAQGGYIVCGIDDITRNIIGITIDKQYDKFILDIDNIIRDGAILRNDGTCLPPEAITVSTLTTIHDKILCVITIKTDSAFTYYIQGGDSYLRLNASNYKQPTIITTYSEIQYNEMVKNKDEIIRTMAAQIKTEYIEIIKKATQINHNNKELTDINHKLSLKNTTLTNINKELTDSNCKLKHNNAAIINKNKGLAKENAHLQQQLFDSILKQKEIAEKHLAASRRFLSFLCWT